jgi:hypothetical protein
LFGAYVFCSLRKKGNYGCAVCLKQVHARVLSQLFVVGRTDMRKLLVVGIRGYALALPQLRLLTQAGGRRDSVHAVFCVQCAVLSVGDGHEGVLRKRENRLLVCD